MALSPLAATVPTSGEFAFKPPMRAGAAATDGASFESVLGNLAQSAVGSLQAAETAAKAGLAGQMPLQDVVQSVMAAERTMQTAFAVRDKIVSAVLELSHMQI